MADDGVQMQAKDGESRFSWSRQEHILVIKEREERAGCNTISGADVNISVL